jgi:predicted RecA/RadA family phage recombinase
MRNFVQEGNALDLTAPAGGVVAGFMYLIGAIVAVAAVSVGAGEKFAGWTEGVYDLPAEAGVAWAEGDKVYLKADGTVFTKTAAGNKLAGVAAEAKDAAAIVGRIKLVPSL